MKKIALFTIYKARNYGTQLQAQALYGILNKIAGDDSVQILSEEQDSFLNCLFKPFSKNPLIIYKRWKYWKEYKKYIHQYKVGDFDECFDLIVIGSDELWNVRNPDFQHSRRYVGIGFKSNKKIAYAISCNRSTSSDFIQQYGNTPFIELNEISVRDVMTQELVTKISNKQPIRVLDPTFLWDFQASPVKKKNYIMVYGYQFEEDEITEITMFAKAKNLKTVSVGFEQRWCDQVSLCSAKEFLGYVQNATYVVTSTFHGTVFSIKYNKQFASYARDNCKVNDLLEHFSLESRNSSNYDLSLILQKEISYDNINSQIETEKRESLLWLTRNIKE